MRTKQKNIQSVLVEASRSLAMFYLENTFSGHLTIGSGLLGILRLSVFLKYMLLAGLVVVREETAEKVAQGC